MLIFHFIYLLKIHEYLYYRISFPYKIYRIFSELYQTFIYKFSTKGKLNGLGGSISTLFDERMNQNIKLEIAPCRRYLISEDVDSIDVARLLFPFIRRYSRRASSRRRIDGKKRKEKSRLGGNRKNYRAIFRATPSREDVESSVLEIVMQAK